MNENERVYIRTRPRDDGGVDVVVSQSVQWEEPEGRSNFSCVKTTWVTVTADRVDAHVEGLRRLAEERGAAVTVVVPPSEIDDEPEFGWRDQARSNATNLVTAVLLLAANVAAVVGGVALVAWNLTLGWFWPWLFENPVECALLALHDRVVNRDSEST